MCCYAEAASVEMSGPASRASHHHPSGPATTGNCISSRSEFPQAKIVPKKSQTAVARHLSTSQHLIAQRHWGPKRPFASATNHGAEPPCKGSAPGLTPRSRKTTSRARPTAAIKPPHRRASTLRPLTRAATSARTYKTRPNKQPQPSIHQSLEDSA
jgi:hypothetical protein